MSFVRSSYCVVCFVVLILRSRELSSRFCAACGSICSSAESMISLFICLRCSAARILYSPQPLSRVFSRTNARRRAQFFSPEIATLTRLVRRLSLLRFAIASCSLKPRLTQKMGYEIMQLRTAFETTSRCISTPREIGRASCRKRVPSPW